MSNWFRGEDGNKLDLFLEFLDRNNFLYKNGERMKNFPEKLIWKCVRSVITGKCSVKKEKRH